MVQRIYMSKSIIQLREIALQNLHDSTVILNLRHELSYRSTKSARQLLTEIDSGTTISAPGPPPLAQVVSEMTTADHEMDHGLASRYEELRQTFTVKGSLLSRWGMTEIMPKDFMQAVIELWSTRITDVPDQFGRTKDLLIKNMLDLGFETEIMRENIPKV